MELIECKEDIKREIDKSRGNVVLDFSKYPKEFHEKLDFYAHHLLLIRLWQSIGGLS